MLTKKKRYRRFDEEKRRLKAGIESKVGNKGNIGIKTFWRRSSGQEAIYFRRERYATEEESQKNNGVWFESLHDTKPVWWNFYSCR